MLHADAFKMIDGGIGELAGQIAQDLALRAAAIVHDISMRFDLLRLAVERGWVQDARPEGGEGTR